MTISAVTVKEVMQPMIQISDGSRSITLDPTADAVHHLGDPDVIVYVEGMDDARAIVDAIAMGRIHFDNFDEVEDRERDEEMYGAMTTPEFIQEINAKAAPSSA